MFFSVNSSNDSEFCTESLADRCGTLCALFSVTFLTKTTVIILKFRLLSASQAQLHPAHRGQAMPKAQGSRPTLMPTLPSAGWQCQGSHQCLRPRKVPKSLILPPPKAAALKFDTEMSFRFSTLPGMFLSSSLSSPGRAYVGQDTNTQPRDVIV